MIAHQWPQFVAHKLYVALAIALLFFVLTAFVAFVLREMLVCVVTLVGASREALVQGGDVSSRASAQRD